jgi:DNA invertase Pin-like site-specific DNA recombinase
MPRSNPSRKRCAVYTRKSSEEGLEQEFNSLAAQREACEAYIRSQRHEGWASAKNRYDDGGFSGGTMERPALQRLLADIRAGRIDIVIVYKVDRLTRSLADFARLVEIFDAQGASFVSVTQQFNTTSSMGRLTLNVLLSFAQFEREVTGERIRDKIAASKKKGMWMGGNGRWYWRGMDSNPRSPVRGLAFSGTTPPDFSALLVICSHRIGSVGSQRGRSCRKLWPSRRLDRR